MDAASLVKVGAVIMGQMGTGGTDASVSHISLEDQAYQLHCRGFSLRTIGRMLEIDKDTAQRYVKAVAKELGPKRKKDREKWTEEAVEHLQEVARQAWMHYSVTTDLAALNTVAATIERIAKLRGLYAPEVSVRKHEISGPNGQPIEFSFADLVAEITAGSGEDSEGGSQA